MSNNSFSAKAIRAGYNSAEHYNSVNPPIYQTASFDLQDIDRTRRLWTGAEAGGIYSRVGTPTGAVLEERIAELDELPRQLYITVAAPNEEVYKKTCRPKISLRCHTA